MSKHWKDTFFCVIHLELGRVSHQVWQVLYPILLQINNAWEMSFGVN